VIRMYPKNHILTSATPILLYALLVNLPPRETIIWAVLAATAAVLIDLDHFVLLLLMKDRRHTVFDIATHPLNYVDVEKIRNRIHFKGFGILRMKAHLAETFGLSLLFLCTRPPYSVPILASLLIHCTMDLYEMIRDPDSR
jgi:hypothetical protein